MRHFGYYPNGGPFPGVCALCGINKELWDTAVEHFRGGSFMVCTGCVSELAENIGYGPRIPYEDTIATMRAEINKLTTLLDAVPTQTEGLINGIRSIVTDFVFAVSNSGNTNVSAPVQTSSKVIGADDESDKPADVSVEAPVESAFVKRPNGVPTTAGGKRTSATRK